MFYDYTDDEKPRTKPSFLERNPVIDRLVLLSAVAIVVLIILLGCWKAVELLLLLVA